MSLRTARFLLTPLLLVSLTGAASAEPSDIVQLHVDESRLSELFQPARVVHHAWDDDIDELVVENGGEAIRVEGVLVVRALWRADGQPHDRQPVPTPAPVVDRALGSCSSDALRLEQAPTRFQPSLVDILPRLDQDGVYEVIWRCAVSLRFDGGGWQGIRVSGRQLEVELNLDQPGYADDVAEGVRRLERIVGQARVRAQIHRGSAALPHGVASYLEASLPREASREGPLQERHGQLESVRTYLRDGDLFKAEAALTGLTGEDVTALRHALEVRLKILSGIRSKCKFLRQQTWSTRGNSEAALDYLRRYERREAWSRCGILHLELAHTFLDLGRHSEARAALERARSINPGLAVYPEFKELERWLNR